MALAMCSVIIEDGLYDRDFVSRYCEGFDGFREHLAAKGYTPAWAEPITGIKAETITRLAREFATTKPAMSAIFKGSGYYTNGADAARALLHPRRDLRRGRQAGKHQPQGLGAARRAREHPESAKRKPRSRRCTSRWATRLRRTCPIRACPTRCSTATRIRSRRCSCSRPIR
jgi:thiosulfate reductase/polysulfide reductase chain A